MLTFRGGTYLKCILSLILCSIIAVLSINLLLHLVFPASTNTGDGQKNTNRKNALQIFFLVFLLAICLIIFFYSQSYMHIKRTYLSFRLKPNSIKSLDELFGETEKNKVKKEREINNQDEQQFENKLKRLKKKKKEVYETVKNPVHGQVKKYSLIQAFQFTKKKQGNRKNSCFRASQSDLYYYEYQDQNQKPSNDQKKKIKQMQQNFKSQLKKLKIEHYSQQIQEVKHFLGKILNKQIQLYKLVKILIKSYYQQIYDCEIVWSKKELGQKIRRHQNLDQRRSSIKTVMYGQQLYRARDQYVDKTVHIDSLLMMYRKGKIDKMFLRRQSTKRKQLQNGRKILRNIQIAFQQQVKMDQVFGFRVHEGQQSNRHLFEQDIAKIAQKLLMNENMFDLIENKKLKYFKNTYQLSKHLYKFFCNQLNSHLPLRFHEKIYLQHQIYLGSQKNKGQDIFIISLKRDISQSHYTLKKQNQNYDTKPGKDNFFSVFMIYLSQLKANRKLNLALPFKNLQQLFQRMQFQDVFFYEVSYSSK